MGRPVIRIFLLLVFLLIDATVYGQVQPPWLGNQTNAGHIDHYTGQPGAWHLAGTEDYTYTAWGDPLTYVYNDSSTNKHTEYFYDVNSRLIRRVETSGALADTMLYSYSSYPSGLLHSVTSGRFTRGFVDYVIQSFSYNQTGRLDSIFYKDSVGRNYFEFTKLKYDSIGLIKRISTYQHSNPLLSPALISDDDSLVYAFNRQPNEDPYRYAIHQDFNHFSDFLPYAFQIKAEGRRDDLLGAYHKIGSENGLSACAATYENTSSGWQRIDSSCLENNTQGYPVRYQFYSFIIHNQYNYSDNRTYDVNGNLAERIYLQTGNLGTYNHRYVFSQYITATQPRLPVLSIHPNPAKNTLNIAGLAGHSFYISDALGRQYHPSHSTDGVVNLTGMPSGIYVLQVGNRQARFVIE